MAGIRLRGRSAEFWLATVGTIAGVIGAAAAVAVFVFPAKSNDPPVEPARTISAEPSPSISGGIASGSPTPAPTLPATEVRYLTALSPTAGVGFLHANGQNLSVSCPTNQSDDTYHDVTYALPALYSQFTAEMTVGGEADQEATASVQVFIQHRADRSDVQVQVGEPLVLQQAASKGFTRPLGDAAQLTIRARCTSSSQIVQLTAPRISR